MRKGDPQHTGPLRNIANNCWPCEETIEHIYDSAVEHRNEAQLIKADKTKHIHMAYYHDGFVDGLMKALEFLGADAGTVHHCLSIYQTQEVK